MSFSASESQPLRWRQVSLVLLRASRADPHAACERCWMRWAEEQLEECFAEKKLPRCLWPQCQVPMAGLALFLYQHTP